MKNLSVKKLALAGMFCALCVVGSVFSFPMFGSKCAPVPVSYTHLDVYKRQARMRSRVAGAISGWSFKALLTVATDTPHSFARSFRDGIF